MGNYLKMSDIRRVLALLELGWTYRRIERETGVRRETIARYDPRRESKAANLSVGVEVSTDDGAPKVANLSVGSNAAHGPPGLAVPYRQQIEAGLRQGLTAQRIWQRQRRRGRVPTRTTPRPGATARTSVGRSTGLDRIIAQRLRRLNGR